MKKLIIIIVSLVIISLVVGLVIFTQRFKNRPTSSPTPVAVEPTTVTSIITTEEVAKHNQKTDCWLIIEGVAYDITSFVDSHPGGAIIAMGCGKDATQLFNSRPGNGTAHSDRAREILQQYKLGEVKN